MGCDIHCYAEMKLQGKYQMIRTLPIVESKEYQKKQVFSQRDYPLFAFLNDVRNQFYIREPEFCWGNELPEDISPRIRKEINHWGIDGHSHSYITLQQALDVKGTAIAIQEENSDEFLLCVGGEEMSHDITYRELLDSTEWYPRIAQLKVIADEYNRSYDEVRIIFWFDN